MQEQPSAIPKWLLVLLVLVVLINTVSYFFLPDRIYLQINANWDIHGFSVPPYVFVLMGPLVIAGAFLFARRSSENAKQGLLLSLIAFVGSIATIVFNLLSQ